MTMSQVHARRGRERADAVHNVSLLLASYCELGLHGTKSTSPILHFPCVVERTGAQPYGLVLQDTIH